MTKSKSVKTEVVFSAKNQGNAALPEIRLIGVSPDVLSRPEEIRKIMEVLNLPKGTVARVLHTMEDVIIR